MCSVIVVMNAEGSRKVFVTVMIIIVKNRVTPDGKRIILESPHKKSHYAEEKERRSSELRDIELAEFSFDLFTSIRLPIEAYLPVVLRENRLPIWQETRKFLRVAKIAGEYHAPCFPRLRSSLDWVQIINYFEGFNYRSLMHGDNFLIILISMWGNQINKILNLISQFEDKKVRTDIH